MVFIALAQEDQIILTNDEVLFVEDAEYLDNCENCLHDESNVQLEQDISKRTKIKNFFIKTVFTFLSVLSIPIRALTSLFCMESLTGNNYIDVI